MKADYTGLRCDGGISPHLNEYLLDRATEVPYREFAKNVNVKSFEIKGLSKCDHCTFLRSVLPSGKPAWILQWSGFEHLAINIHNDWSKHEHFDPDEESQNAFAAILSPSGDPIVWWDDVEMIQALIKSSPREEVGLALMAENPWALMDARYKPVFSVRSKFDQSVGEWTQQNLAWVVPTDEVKRVGMWPREMSFHRAERMAESAGVDYYGPPIPQAIFRGISEYASNPIEPQAEKLNAYKQFVDWFARDALQYHEKRALLQASFAGFSMFHLKDFFPGLLLQYEMSPADRKVIEKAAKSRTRRTIRLKDRDIDKTYERELADYRKYLEVAERVITSAKRVDTGACRTAGGFRLLNSGGFSDEIMCLVADVVGEAADKLREAGLESVIYGSINVVNTIRVGKGLLAHYDGSTDEIFVRGNIRGLRDSALKTVVHELGHRLARQFFKEGRAETAMKWLYNRIRDLEDTRLVDVMFDQALWPKEGEVIESRWQVTRVEIVASRYPVIRLKDATSASSQEVAHLTMDSYLRKTGRLRSAFVTPYARTSPAENFAEMIAYFSLGNLSKDQADLLLEAINKGLGL